MFRLMVQRKGGGGGGGGEGGEGVKGMGSLGRWTNCYMYVPTNLNFRNDSALSPNKIH